MELQRVSSYSLSLFTLYCWCMGVALSQTEANQLERLYQDDRIQVAIPATWTERSIYPKNSNVPPSARTLLGVAVSDGPFDLYLLTHYGQASGVKGGRFGEIAPYAVPWLQYDELAACLDIFTWTLTPLSRHFSRVDITLRPKPHYQSNNAICVKLQKQVSHPVWAGAFFGITQDDRRQPGFFINLPLGTAITSSDNQMVFAAACQTTSVKGLPLTNDPHLKAFLEQITRIVDGIRYK